MIMSRKLVRNQTVRKERNHTLMYITSTKCCSRKTKSWENAQTIKVHFSYFLFVTCFYNTKSATIFHFYNKYIYMCIYLYISIYKQFPMPANTTETSTCPNIAISSKDNKRQYNPTLIKLDCHTLT